MNLLLSGCSYDLFSNFMLAGALALYSITSPAGAWISFN